jgi:beta-galactosidase
MASAPYTNESNSTPYTQFALMNRGFVNGTAAWYRRELQLSLETAVMWLEFEGVYRDSQIYLNHQLIGTHLSGYGTFRVNLTQSNATLRQGANLLAVFADARLSEGWWYEGSGVYRPVWLHSTEFVHIPPDGVAVHSQAEGQINSTTQTAESAGLVITTEVRNAEATLQTNVTVQHRVYGPLGGIIAQAATQIDILPARSATAHTAIRLGKDYARNPMHTADDVLSFNVQLWSPGTPVLYTLQTTVQLAGGVQLAGDCCDRINTSFGILHVVMDPHSGLALNNRRVRVRGVCNHQDFAGFGVGVPWRVDAFKVAAMKAMGANAWWVLQQGGIAGATSS